MKSLDRKLFRDLWIMRGQAIAIALVIASGIATFIMSLSTLDSLEHTRATFYRDYRFAEVFCSLKRAPESLRERIAEIPGVLVVDTRVVAAASLDISGFDDPVTGLLISTPSFSAVVDGDDNGAAEPLLNNLYMRKGRLPAPGRDSEVVVSESFALAHGLNPGDELSATINGRRRKLVIVGIALSPEHIFQISPGSIFPDFKRYGIVWMSRTPLATAYDMDGAFNNLALTLHAGANLTDVLYGLDALLDPYGGRGAYGRKDQLSHHYLSEEIRGLAQMATIFPIIFLGVAAFLLNVVVGRIVTTQREQIAILKAFGYTNASIALHYLKLIAMVVIVGIVAGFIAGLWLGKGLSEMYMEFYRFPFLIYVLRPSVVLYAIGISAFSAFLGTVFALRRAALLPPAEAMRPEPPVNYKETFIERMGLKRFFFQPTRMIIRHIERRPVKSLLSVIGIALSCAILMMGNFWGDSIDYMVDVQFGMSEREDLVVSFTEPASKSALYEFQSMPGVEYVEPFRAVPVRLRFEHRSHRTVVQGFLNGADLRRVIGEDLKPITMPAEGILLTDYLGKMLGVREGDMLTVSALEGSRPVTEIEVAGFVKQYMGVSAYMELSALNRLMDEGGALSGVNLAIDPDYQKEIYAMIKEMPRVAGSSARRDALRSFRETMAEQILVFTLINTLLAAVIAFGVVYNTARIALSERSRELASLRVLGFTRAEISYILLGELAVIVLAAIPVGFLIGWGLCVLMAVSFQSDLYRIPLVVEGSTYAFSALVVIVSGCVSALIVRRRLDKLDLVAVLKTRE